MCGVRLVVGVLLKMTNLVSLEQLASVKDGSGHSIFSPSASSMWLACPGSLVPNLLLPDEGNPDSAYGTVAHAVTETWLKNGRCPTHMLHTVHNVDGFEIEVDEQMLYHAEQAVDRCEWEPGEHVIERKVWFSHLTPIPRQGGTLDFAALWRRTAVVTDHKFGKAPDGIVYATENTQAMLYAIGLLNDPEFTHYDLQDFVLRISQPRLDHFDEWHTTRKDLIEFGHYVKERAALAWSFDAPRVPGPKQCRYCKVRGSCPDNAKFQEDLLNGVFNDESESVQQFTERLNDENFELRFEDIGLLSIEQKARLLPYRSMAEAWWARLQRDLEQHARAGHNVPGYKLVEGRTKRLFSDDERALAALKAKGLEEDDLVTRKMATPAQVEKLLARELRVTHKRANELLKELVVKPPGKASLVPLSDRREPIEDPSSAVFEDESQSVDEEEL